MRRLWIPVTVATTIAILATTCEVAPRADGGRSRGPERDASSSAARGRSPPRSGDEADAGAPEARRDGGRAALAGRPTDWSAARAPTDGTPPAGNPSSATSPGAGAEGPATQPGTVAGAPGAAGTGDPGAASLRDPVLPWVAVATAAAPAGAAKPGFRDVFSVRDFGASCDGVSDDWPAFRQAAAAAAAAGRPLDVRDCRLYLASQDAPVSTDGLVIVGTGSVPWDDSFVAPASDLLMAGDGAAFAAVKAFFVAKAGSIVVSRFDGPIFRGKQLRGHDFTVVGDASRAASSAFVQSTPAGYPGWSQGVSGLTRFSAYYFGSHGVELKGGLELTDVRDVVVSYCRGICIYIHQQRDGASVLSPIEYLRLANVTATHGLRGNLVIDGISKDVEIDGFVGNDPGQLRLRVARGELPPVTSAAQIVWPIRLAPSSAGTIVAAQNVSLRRIRAEGAQGLVLFDASGDPSTTPFWRNVSLEDTFFIPLFAPGDGSDHTGAVAYSAGFGPAKVYNLFTRRNDSRSSPARFWFDPGGAHAGSTGLDVDEGVDGFSVEGASLAPRQFRRPGALDGDLDRSFSTTANLSTAPVGAQSCAAQRLPLAGATSGTECAVGAPAQLESGLTVMCISRTGEVEVRICNVTAAPITPSDSQTVRVRVFE